MRTARRATPLLVLGALTGASAWGVGCGRERPSGPVPGAAGVYRVAADSSRVNFVVQRNGQAALGAFPEVRGVLTFRGPLGAGRYLEAAGSLTVPLATVLDDSSQASALATTFFETQRRPEFKTAEVVVRRLYGHRLTADVPLGATVPASANIRLVVHAMSIAREFDVEISRTPSGFRVTNAVPFTFSLAELGFAEEIAAWLVATGVESLGDAVAVTVDVRLVPRPPAEESS